MNDMYEVWSLPWHALQKSLAGGIGAKEGAVAVPNNAVPRRNATCARNAAGRRGAAGCADSWLYRARCRGVPLPAL
jgi:hypothetical protein